LNEVINDDDDDDDDDDADELHSVSRNDKGDERMNNDTMYAKTKAIRRHCTALTQQSLTDTEPGTRSTDIRTASTTGEATPSPRTSFTAADPTTFRWMTLHR